MTNNLFVGFYYVAFSVNIGIVLIGVDWKAMRHFSVCVEKGMIYLGSETITGNEFVVIIVHQYIEYLSHCLLVLTFFVVI